MLYRLILITIVSFLIISCKKEVENVVEDEINNMEIIPGSTFQEDDGPRLYFRLVLDPNQERLDIFGQPEVMPSNHSAINPVMEGFAIHTIELVPNAYTAFGAGEMVYYAPMLAANHAVIFDSLQVVQTGDIVYSIPISQVEPGTYEYSRVSVAYQNYDVPFRAYGFDLVGRVSSFLGHNNYISKHKIKDLTVTVNDSKGQGYFAFETPEIVVGSYVHPAEYNEYTAPVTTVPNPISGTSPIPLGSCTLTGQFPTSFTLTGNETSDIYIDLSFSTNNSFEWEDANGNGIYEPLDGDVVHDMGVRGLIPKVAP